MDDRKSAWAALVQTVSKVMLKLFEMIVEDAILIFEDFLSFSTLFTLGLLFAAYVISRELRLIILYAEYYTGIGIEDGLLGIQTIINFIIKGVDKVGSGAVSVLSLGTKRHAVNIQPVDIVDKFPFVKTMIAILGECNRVDSTEKETFALLKIFTSPYVCPVVRYTYPTFVYEPFSFLLGPFIYSAKPTPGCERPANVMECELANIYRLFEVIIYIFIGWKILKHTLNILEYVFIDGIWQAIKHLIKELYDGIHERIKAIHDRFELSPIPSY